LPAAITIEKLTKSYKGLLALDNLDLKVPSGTVYGYLGPNGAGKTTTLKILTSLIKPTSGKAYFFDQEVTKEPETALIHVGAIVETPEFYNYMTPVEILSYFGKLRGLKNPEIEENSSRFLKLVGLDDWKKKKIATFSRGMKQRLALAQALLHDPQILLLDEPTIGLDPRGMAEVREIFRSLKKEGKTIFMSSHLIREVQEICDSVALIDKGRLILSNTIESLTQKSDSVDIEMKLIKPPPPEQIALVKRMEGIESVTQVNPTTLRINYKGNFDNVVLLLKRIVNQDLKIYSFKTTQGDLEALYMKMIRESVR